MALIDHLALGGAELMLGNFAAGAPASGIDLSVACLNEGDGNPAAQRLRAAGVEPVTLNVPERLGVAAVRAVRRHVAEVGPDLVHTHLGSSDVLGSVAAASLGVPAVSTLHAMAWGSGAKARAKFTVSALARRWCADRVIAVSESSRRAYAAHSVVDPTRVVTIHNGIDVAAEPGAGAGVRRELGLREDDFVVGMVSALRHEKGHDIALEAVAALRGEHPRLRLLIVGGGPLEAEIARMAAPLGDAVVLTGLRHDVMRILDCIDVCLHPSRADALPTTLIEAMAASVPVLASAVGGIPEIVADGRTGILVDAPVTREAIAAALIALMDDPVRRGELATAGRERYEQEFTSGPWIRRIRALYDAVLAESR
jgi:glycosyltransferase involved in cell wall biosynthesis